MWSFKGFIAVVITGAVLSVPLYFYWEFLTRGMRPPEATLKLNDLETSGVPDFTLKTLDGRKVSLSDYRGRIAVVNIWATWCAPCVKEFPSLQGLVKAMGGKVVVIAVSYDRTREDIETFIKAFGGVPENFLVVWDQEKITTRIFGTDVLPETYIISQQGKLIRKIAGETTWDDPMALRFFNELDQTGGVK